MNPRLQKNTPPMAELDALRARVLELETELARRDQAHEVAHEIAREAALASASGVSDAVMLRAILDDLPDHIYFKDRQSRFFQLGKAHARKFGLQGSAEAVGKTDFDFFTPEHAQQAFEDEQEIVRTGRPLTNIVEKETWIDGRVSWVSTTKLPLRDEAGNIIGTFGVTRDITEMKLMEERLEKERLLLRTLIDSLPESIYFKDSEGRCIACNKAYYYLAGGRTPEEVIGKTVYDLYPQELADNFFAADQQVIKTRQPYINPAERRILMDGKEHFLMVTKVPLLDGEGNCIGIVGASHDITQLTQTSRQLEKYAAELDEANVELKKFTYIVSHDLRAPLVNLKGFSMELKAAVEVIRRTTGQIMPQLEEAQREELGRALNEEVPEALQFINSSVTRMDGFINALLQLSRLGHRDLRLATLDQNELVEATLMTLAHQIEQRKISVTVDDLPTVIADKTSMEQIWSNLINNAIVYMKSGRPGRIHISGERQGEEAVYRVLDNGRGIREDDMDKVFAPFRRAGKQDVPGEGMGLSYVQTLVRRHGGNIRCESREDVGTTFIFTIRNPKAKGTLNA